MDWMMDDARSRVRDVLPPTSQSRLPFPETGRGDVGGIASISKTRRPSVPVSSVHDAIVASRASSPIPAGAFNIQYSILTHACAGLGRVRGVWPGEGAHQERGTNEARGPHAPRPGIGLVSPRAVADIALRSPRTASPRRAELMRIRVRAPNAPYPSRHRRRCPGSTQRWIEPDRRRCVPPAGCRPLGG
ncbi:hypothetical protein C8Q74DRAFT_759782 [Fomes fomentarius]|nr:hypothetical protein C8Q74DRAFT_759782 [Fomes fomentarius]